jgi:hypothetical protein
MSVVRLRLLRAGLLLCVLLGATACRAPQNPSFALTLEDARADLERMRAEPRPLDRPLVIASGYGDPGFVPWLLGNRVRSLTHGDSAMTHASFFFIFDFENCRDKLIAAVERDHPSDDPDWTTEVDVIGYSMGGLVARFAALPREDGGKRLRIRRLFTISSPHRGANLANLPTLEPRVWDMKAGSKFLKRLDEALAAAPYKLCCYVTLGDFIVGAKNASPPGEAPWWTAGRFLQPAHFSAWNDPRIIADIARRLRGEEPWTTDPPAPLPEE